MSEEVHVSFRDRKLLEAAVVLREEALKRRENDPLRTFELFSPQDDFADAIINQKTYEAYYVGANRSGKSDAGAFTGATLARFGFNNDSGRVSISKVGGSTVEVRSKATSGWVSAIDFPTSRDTIQPKYFDNGFVPPSQTHAPFIPEREIAEWRVSDQILKLKNGSIIGFKSADSGRTKYQGAEKNWIHFDEEHPEPIYDEAVIRVGATPLSLFTTCTLLPPEGMVGGVTWVFPKIIQPWKDGKKDDVMIFNASIYNNPHILREEIRRLENRYAEGSIQRRIRLNGELLSGLSGARIYTGFSHQINVTDDMVFVPQRPILWTWDFNIEPMCSLIGQYDGKVIRIFKEILLEEANIAEMCVEFKRQYPNHRNEIRIYGDATANNRSHQTRMSSYTIILNNMSDYPKPCRLYVPESNPSVTDRVNAVNESFRDEHGLIGMEIHPDCVELIQDLNEVVGDGKQGIKKTTNKKDPYYRRTHPSDALGYLVHSLKPVVPADSNRGRGRGKSKHNRPSYGRE